MENFFLKGYIFISIALAGIDGLIAWKSFRRKKKTGIYLGLCCLMAGVVDISYLASILEKGYFYSSAMASIYFSSIDLMLLFFLRYMIEYAGFRIRNRKLERAVSIGILGYALFDIIMFAINPFNELVISYQWRETAVACYRYQWKPLYVMHLGYAYLLLVIAIILLLNKRKKAPEEYRNPYNYICFGIGGIVLINAGFLMLPVNGIYNLLDYSICGYSFILLIIYWSCFEYSTHGLLNRLKTRVFENVDQGLILFDYEEKLILVNRKAEKLLETETLSEGLTLKEFMSGYHIYLGKEYRKENNVIQFYVKHEEEVRPLLCDIRILYGKHGQILGHLLTLTDMTFETDMLTGFQTYKSFRKFLQEKGESFSTQIAVGICDINGLAMINSTKGSESGDQMIHELADLMREYCPKQTYFVRGNDAYLIALSTGTSENELLRCLKQVSENYSGNIQYAVDKVTEEEPDIRNAIHRASESLQTKKLLDQDSSHSDMLSSLIRALSECDSDTENHVKRTREIGEKLGKRIHLTDFQLSQLSLLCLLHDIGKIGIPLDILNKPGKLSAEEWAILQTHTVKGYEIAKSNKAFQSIADEILHHHERWDGKGYPDGLSCESIPLLSRVIAIVDAYDAMVNNRAYRAAREPADAMQELMRCAGTQFDPSITSEFLQILKEDPALVERDTEQSKTAETEAYYSIDRESSTDGYQNVHVLEYTRYRLNPELKIIEVDDRFEQFTGYSRADVEEKNLNQIDLIPEVDRTEYLKLVNVLNAKDQRAYLEHRIRRKDGSEIYVMCYGRWFYFTPAREERIEVMITDATNTYYMKKLAETERTKAQKQQRYWEKMYRSDSLTGLLNHASFQNDVEKRLMEGGTRTLFFMMDLDRFKQYNDTYGHRAGDEYLILTAHTLQSILRENDRACRMGGDEFAAAVFFDKSIPEERIRERAQQIFDKITMTLSAAKGGAGISAGVVITGEGRRTFNDIYEVADRMLYESKKQGRGRLTVNSSSAKEV